MAFSIFTFLEKLDPLTIKFWQNTKKSFDSTFLIKLGSKSLGSKVSSRLL